LISEDEWYKAAYYKPGSTGSGYWDYPTRGGIAPSNLLLEPDPGNCANTAGSGNQPVWCIGEPYWRTTVGEFENSESPCGTFDQGGNLMEWNEALTERFIRSLRHQPPRISPYHSRRISDA